MFCCHGKILEIICPRNWRNSTEFALIVIVLTKIVLKDAKFKICVSKLYFCKIPVYSH